jgi:hypothetical protein
MYVANMNTNRIIKVQMDVSGTVVDSDYGGFSAAADTPGQLVIESGVLYIAGFNNIYNIPIPSGSYGISYSGGVGNTTNETGLTILGNRVYTTAANGASIAVYTFPGFAPLQVSPPYWNSSSLNASIGLYNFGGNVYGSNVGSILEFSPYIICFLKATKILCQENGVEIYKPIEEIKQGVKVKTLLNGYMPVDKVTADTVYNPDNDERTKERLYLLSKSVYPELHENLVITGGHSTLVERLTISQKSEITSMLGEVFVTDNLYRLPACVDDRAVVYPREGTFDIYHICLENTNEYTNYGIWANGLLVESCCKRHI